MPTFVDPRTDPKPCAGISPAAVTDSPDELEELHRLCREGRLYDVEAWIKAGHPLQLSGEGAYRRRFPTALTIAIETRQHSLLLLLLCNGYRLGLEPAAPLTLALEARRWDLVDLFWAWGADPLQVGGDTVFATYNSALFERFYAAGVDFLQGHALGDAPAHHTSNKPLFGFAKRHLPTDPRFQVELNIALRRHVYEGHVKGVLLSLWAGADPHAPTLDLDYPEDEEANETAIAAVVTGGHANLLPILKPDPTRDNVEALYRWARNSQTVETLAKIAPPRMRDRPFGINCSTSRHASRTRLATERGCTRWRLSFALAGGGPRRRRRNSRRSDTISARRVTPNSSTC